MSTNERNSIRRRDFIRGAAAVAGAPILVRSGLANLLPTFATAPMLAFWNGSQFVAADSLASGDSTLEAVTVTLGRQATGGLVTSVSALFRSGSGARSTTKTYRAWGAGSRIARFSMPTRSTNTIELSVSSAGTEVKLGLTTSNRRGPKLREGAYVLVENLTALTGLGFQTGESTLVDSQGAPASLPYFTIEVERA